MKLNIQTSLAMAIFAATLVGCGPSPEAVCQKTYDLAKAEVGEAVANKAIGGDMASCVKTETMRKEMQGMAKYKSNNECLMKSAKWADVKACSK